MVKYQREKAVNLACQLSALKKLFPQSSGEIKRSSLTWKLSVSPTPLSAAYLLEIHYHQEYIPKVFISGGKLTDEDAVSSAPHKYSFDPKSLKIQACLSRFDWKKSMLISKTLVPWAMEWMFYYEIWRFTGNWIGDEAPHSAPKKAP